MQNDKRFLTATTKILGVYTDGDNILLSLGKKPDCGVLIGYSKGFMKFFPPLGENLEKFIQDTHTEFGDIVSVLFAREQDRILFTSNFGNTIIMPVALLTPLPSRVIQFTEGENLVSILVIDKELH